MNSIGTPPIVQTNKIDARHTGIESCDVSWNVLALLWAPLESSGRNNSAASPSGATSCRCSGT